MATKFYRCSICGNIIVKIIDSGVNPVCCGKSMEELVAKTSDMGMEKHVPAVTKIDDHTLKVEVGSVPHPMVDEHFIQWIYLETETGGQFVNLTPQSQPVALFDISQCKPVAVYEFCNLHGLWKKSL